MSQERRLAKTLIASDDFDAIYQAEAAHVWNYLRRLGIPERYSEDALHDSFLIAYRQLESFDASRPIRPWLFGIAFRVASDFHRRAFSRHEILTGDIDVTSNAQRADTALARSHLQHVVQTELEKLSFDQRVVFVLHEIEGHSIPEIAEMLGESTAALYSRLWRARKQFIAGVRRDRKTESEGDG